MHIHMCMHMHMSHVHVHVACACVCNMYIFVPTRWVPRSRFRPTLFSELFDRAVDAMRSLPITRPSCYVTKSEICACPLIRISKQRAPNA